MKCSAIGASGPGPYLFACSALPPQFHCHNNSTLLALPKSFPTWLLQRQFFCCTVDFISTRRIIPSKLKPTGLPKGSTTDASDVRMTVGSCSPSATRRETPFQSVRNSCHHSRSDLAGPGSLVQIHMVVRLLNCCTQIKQLPKKCPAISDNCRCILQLARQ